MPEIHNGVLSPTTRQPPTVAVVAAVLAALIATGLWAQVAPETPPIAEKAFRHADLTTSSFVEPIARLPRTEVSDVRDALVLLGIPEGSAYIDRRSGRFGTLLLSRPLIPGEGRANGLTWFDTGMPRPTDSGDLEHAAGQALIRFLAEHRDELAIETAELASPQVTSHGDGQLIQIHIPRTFAGLPVRDSFVTAVINRGNLVLLGTRNWGSIELSPQPDVSVQAARLVLAEHLLPFKMGADWKRSELLVVPIASDADLPTRSIGAGYDHRVAWAIRTTVAGQIGAWEALVDAQTGELLSFLDTHLYDSPRKVAGGIFPADNTGAVPEGIEQSSYPMPFSEATDSSRTHYGDSGGNLAVCVDGNISTALDGTFVEMTEICGAISETSSTDIDLGTSPDTDCSTPPGGSPGNTRSARTTYYHLNRAHEAGRGRLPENAWLESKFPAVTNFPSELFLGCNALWDGSGVLFTSSALPDGIFPNGCSATGELPGVVVHEWSHGLDDNDANSTVSNPAEGIADIFPALWFDESCIARGFYQGTNCSTGTLADGLDACLDCDGVREIDWRKRAENTPHTISFIDTFCPLDLLGAGGPCLGSPHCEGHLVSEAAWDLAYHDLQGAPFNLDQATAVELATRLFTVGSGLVGSWFQCVPGAGIGDGCNAGGGYLNLLAADDDNGDLTDGTPHMSAIYTAFNRHTIACDSPTPQDSGCATGPAASPAVNVQPLDRAARLTWSSVAGADRYDILRSEGVAGCDYARAKVGETDGLEFVDQGLLNGFDYHYIVVPVGSTDTCIGPASSCQSVSPLPGPNLSIDVDSAALIFAGGDSDPVIDNCEEGDLAFEIHNIGATPLTNVRITDVRSVSHPDTVLITTPLPQSVAGGLNVCEIAAGSFGFSADGLAFNDTVEFLIKITADELAGLERTATIRLDSAETDFQFFTTKTFDFESDLDNWEVVQGTFERTNAGGGAAGTSFYLASSNDIPNQCDEVRSPLLRLQPTSTLSLSTNFDIEPFFDLEGLIFWFDRANVAVVDSQTGVRTPVNPDGGRLYNASGTDGTCVTADQDGWADSMPVWAESTFSAIALDSSGLAGQTIQLDVGFATDDGNWDGQSRYGFWFDQVTVTDLDLLVDDQQSDACIGKGKILGPPVRQPPPATSVEEHVKTSESSGQRRRP